MARSLTWRPLILGLMVLLTISQPASSIAQETAPTPVRVAMASHLGVFQPIIEALFRRAGFEPAVSLYPARRSIEVFRAGEADFEAGRLAETVEGYGIQASLVGPIGCASLFAYARAADAISIDSAADLKRYTVGIPTGNFSAESYVTRHGLEHYKASHESLVKMLDAQRIQVLVSSAVDAAVVIQAAGKSRDLIAVSDALNEGGSYILVRPDRPEWVRRLQQQLGAEIRSGQWQRELRSAAPHLAVELGRNEKCRS